MVLLLTVMGEVRAAGTYTINITHGKILSSDDAFALSVLYLYEDVIKIFEDGEGHKDVAQNVIPYGNITLFRYDINTGECSLPFTTSSANNLTQTLSPSTQALLPTIFPTHPNITSIALTFPDPEVYVAYNSGSSTLTFCYDHKRSTFSTTYNLNTGSNAPDWNGKNLSTVTFDYNFRYAHPTSCYKWFDGMTYLKTINGIEYLNTNDVTNMAYMFHDCSNLTSIDVSHFNTANVTNMSCMFRGCEDLTSLNVSNFNTSKVTKIFHMFYDCYNLTSLNLSNFTITSSTTTYNMFLGMRSLQTLTLSSSLVSYLNSTACSLIGTDGHGNFDTPCALEYPTSSHLSNVQITEDYVKWNGGYFTCENMKPYAFMNGSTLTFCYDDYYASRKTTSTVFDLNTGITTPEWHSRRESITSVIFNSSFSSARPTSCYYWFLGMKNLTSITGLGYLNTTNVTSMSHMFYDCSGLTSLNLSNFNTAKVTSMMSMFYGCSGLTSLNLSNFNTAKVTSMTNMFYGCSGLTSLNLSNFNTAKVDDMGYMFSGCYRLTSLDLSSFTITSETNTSNMLKSLSALKTLIVSNSLVSYLNDNACQGVGSTTSPCNLHYPDTAHPTFSDATPDYVVWKGGYFSDIKPYVNLDGTRLTFYCDNMRSARPGTIYNLNTGTTDTEWETAGVNTTVTWVDFDSSFANARPTTTYSWFYNMQNLEQITGLQQLNTSAVTNMVWMFGRCSALTSLDLSSFNTANVTDMTAMFYGCSGLTSLDLVSFNTANVSSMKSMFYGCSELATIYAGEDWNTDGVSSSNSTSMFEGCTSLVGGEGTEYSSYYVNKDRAHIDGGIDNPGYFSMKPYAQLDGSTLTFYYDAQYGKRQGRSLGLNADRSAPKWYVNRTSITSVIFDSSFANACPATCFWWFSGMTNLNSITHLEYLNTANATDMTSMFQGCSGLDNLDLSSFNTANVTNMSNMFRGCSDLTTIYVGDGWTTDGLTTSSNMFLNCTHLMGMLGTTYDANHVDAGYAHVDHGQNDPGYFTKQHSFMLGDVNDDDMVDINDAVTLANYLIGQTPAIFISDVADVNQDGEVSIADVTTIINNVLVADAKAELMTQIKTSKEMLDACMAKLREMGSAPDHSDLWSLANEIAADIEAVKTKVANATTQDDIDDCNDDVNAIATKLATLNVRINQLMHG